MNITLNQLYTWGSTLIGICGVIAYIVKPFSSFLSRIKKIEDDQQKFDDKISKSEQNDKMILKCLNAILLHMETGNSTGELRKQKKELDDYLIDNK